ncbi:MAG: hypothetical protein ACYDEY_09085 [Acidimicrobiales bacterium]
MIRVGAEPSILASDEAPPRLGSWVERRVVRAARRFFVFGPPGGPYAAEKPWSSWGRQDVVSAILGTLIAVAVCYPFIGGGRLYLLDWVLGPHPALPNSSFYGLNGGLVAGLPFQLVTAALGRALGSVATWLIVMAFFPIAAVGISRLADIGWVEIHSRPGDPSGLGGRSPAAAVVRRSAAALLYCVNPFVFDRLFAGQIAFLLGYALVPYATASLVRARRVKGVRSLAPALWIAAAVGCAVHYTWICGLLLVGALASCRFTKQAWIWILSVGAALVVMSIYVLVPVLGHQLPVTVGQRNFEAFRTTGDPHLGLFVNVAGLYGFWRVGPVLAKYVVTGWPFILLAILIVVAVGVREGLRRNGFEVNGGGTRGIGDDAGEGGTVLKDDRRALAVILLVAGVAGYFLAMGSQGPTGAVFSWAYFHLPFFDTMREPEKFSSLLALGYSVFFAWGVEHLVMQARAFSGRVVVSVLALALPLAYTPTLFGGLDGQVAVSHPPASWTHANAVMGAGEGKLLFLPWHLYLSFPFTHGMIISNPAPGSFTRDVISGDNIQLPGVPSNSTSRRSAFLQYVLENGSAIHSFGHLVAPLGVRWIALAKTVDWRGYRWLNHQSDLTKVLDTRSLDLWRNDASVYAGRRLARAPERTSTSAWPGILARYYGATPQRSHPRKRSRFSGTAHSEAHALAHKVSQVAFEVGPGRGSWIELSQPYEPGWKSPEGGAVELADGNLAVPAGRGATVVRYGPWQWIMAGYAVSGGTFILILASIIGTGVWERRSTRSSSRQPTGVLE